MSQTIAEKLREVASDIRDGRRARAYLDLETLANELDAKATELIAVSDDQQSVQIFAAQIGSNNPFSGPNSNTPQQPQGQDRQNYTDAQDRESYTVSSEYLGADRE